ncbi:hypothetical protein GSI01S_21_00450 [Gordonia sihwensis NBRC 108236]|uniref:Uncharacterized protein n=1 Tax=Gordonia sihwensis NBRC 108236 TaxID=1223544 RepID=L7LNV5_9ACTN|nr:hypothetical protein GSI01S_21_00450 [Gordonia sihwensis NBRC 108236]
MAVTLAEAAVLFENQLSRAIHEMFVQESPILDRLPLMPIEGNAYATTRSRRCPVSRSVVSARHTPSRPARSSSPRASGEGRKRTLPLCIRYLRPEAAASPVTENGR